MTTTLGAWPRCGTIFGWQEILRPPLAWLRMHETSQMCVSLYDQDRDQLDLPADHSLANQVLSKLCKLMKAIHVGIDS